MPPAVPKTYTFEDVPFDLDGYTPRREAVSVLDAAVTTLMANPAMNVNA